MKIEFTEHANRRIKKRKITKEEIEDTIKYPDKTIKKYDMYFFQKKLQRGQIEVVCEKTESLIKVVTVYWI